jgi:hypothetical protein
MQHVKMVFLVFFMGLYALHTNLYFDMNVLIMSGNGNNL